MKKHNKKYLLNLIFLVSFNTVAEEMTPTWGDFLKWVNDNKGQAKNSTQVDVKKERKEEGRGQFSLGFSPFQLKKINNEKDINVDLSISYDKSIYEYRLFYNYFSFSSTDVLSGVNVSASEQNLVSTLDFNHFSGRFSHFFMLLYHSEREGNVDIIAHDIQGSPLGIKYDLVKPGKKIKDFDISFIPLYEYLEENVESDESANSSDTVFIKLISHHIRLSLRLKLKLKLGNMSFKNTFFMQPAYSFEEDKIDSDNMKYKNIFKYGYALTNFMKFKYTNTFEWDNRRSLVHRLPRSDMIQQFSLEFSFPF